MIKRAFLGIFILLIVMSFSSALSINMNENYSRQETMIISIEGSVTAPILKANVEFRRGHVIVPLEYDVRKIGERYYIWAIAPENSNNYTLILKEISSISAGKQTKANYEKNFSVLENLTNYYISPGFIYSDKDFEIDVFLNLDSAQMINIDYGGQDEIIATPGKNTIKLYLNKITGTQIINITIGKYILPAYVKGTGEVVPASANFSEILINASDIMIINNLSNYTGNVTLNYSSEKLINYNCAELRGIKCEAGKSCSGIAINTSDTKNASEGICCTSGSCVIKEEATDYGWIAYLIIAVVVIGGILIWLKYRGVKKEQHPVQRKVSEIEEKMPKM